MKNQKGQIRPIRFAREFVYESAFSCHTTVMLPGYFCYLKFYLYK